MKRICFILKVLFLFFAVSLYSGNPKMHIPHHYFSSKEVLNWIESCNEHYPDWVKTVKYGYSYLGKKRNKKNLMALEITDKNSNANVEILITAAIHARELMTTYSAIRFVDEILAKLDDEDEEELRELFKKVKLIVIPLLNPDGYDMVMKGWNWRKNCHIYKYKTEYAAPNSYGVNINQNFPVHFRRIHKIWSLEWGGPYPFSEPETKFLAKYLKDKNIDLSIALHSYGRYISFPWWGSLRKKIPDYRRHLKVGRMIKKLLHGYRLQEGCPYLVPGNFGDWVYAKFKCLTFTIEIGDKFNPKEILSKKWYNEIKGGLMFLLKYMVKTSNNVTHAVE